MFNNVKSNLALKYITHTDWSPYVTAVRDFVWILTTKLFWWHYARAVFDATDLYTEAVQ